MLPAAGEKKVRERKSAKALLPFAQYDFLVLSFLSFSFTAPR
jgi:hypothetical protein